MTDTAIRFGGALMKLTRAFEHLNAVAEMVSEYDSGEPYTLSAEDGDEAIYRLTINSYPAPMLGAVIGDVLHNARSALDISACCLVLNFDPTADLAQVQFPLSLSGNRISASDRRRLCDAQPVIDLVEPALRKHEAAFAALRVLSNQDKHRLITTAVVRARAVEVRIDREAGTAKLISSPDVEPELWRKPLESGSIISRGKLPKDGVTFGLALSVGEDAFAISDLNKIVTATDDWLNFVSYGSWISESGSRNSPEVETIWQINHDTSHTVSDTNPDGS